jgi:hypothetical protein
MNSRRFTESPQFNCHVHSLYERASAGAMGFVLLRRGEQVPDPG